MSASKALCAAACLVLGGIGATPPAEDRIAFSSKRDGNWEIYLTDLDGRNQARLTRNTAEDRFPLWSPDRSQIAFGRLIPGVQWENWELAVMNADGSSQRTLARQIVAKGNRQWSRDGKRIVFAGKAEGGDVEIFTVEAASGKLTRLTNSPGDDVNPAWSPDGSRIVFTSMRDGNSEVYVMRSDGTQPQRLTNDAAADVSPAWSPDGSRIAFASARAGEKDVYLMRVDDGRVERLTTGARTTSDPVRWSSDGAHIAVQSSEQEYDVQVVRVADRKRWTVAGSPKYDGQFNWSPAGDAIVFISGRAGFEGVYVADLTGKTRQLTTTASLTPAWVR